MHLAAGLIIAVVSSWLSVQGLPQQAQARLGAENSKLANKLETPCAKSLQSFSQRHENAISAMPDPQHMLYFLHIPRTAGRTYHSCFLKLGSPPSRRCEKSYDILRIDRSLEGCGMLSSHDDISASKMFPANAAFATQIRDPVARAISAYEFSIEVAVRGAYRKERARIDPLMTNTKNVWPWSILVPWMEDDLRQRAASLEKAGPAGWGKAPIVLHDSPIVMPLKEWIEQPLVREVIHDGQTLQVLGLTNYSRWSDAGAVRACMAESQALAESLLPAAIASLQKFVHVGVTEQLEASIQSLAATLGMQLDGPAWEANTVAAFEDDPVTAQIRKKLRLLHRRVTNLAKKVDSATPEQAKRDPALKLAATELEKAYAEQEQLAAGLAASHARPHQVKPDTAFLQKIPLWKAFRTCEHKARNKNAKRRANSMSVLRDPQGQRLQFSHADRASIQPSILARIRELNSMDVALHTEAKRLLEGKLQRQGQEGVLQGLPELGADVKAHLDRLPLKARSLQGGTEAADS